MEKSGFHPMLSDSKHRMLLCDTKRYKLPVKSHNHLEKSNYDVKTLCDIKIKGKWLFNKTLKMLK